jgi:hypothetical protein
MDKIKTLRHLVLHDKCLLHGSPRKIEELRPHYTDGEMAVCATPYVEIAIFMAVVNACRPGTTGIFTSINRKKCSAEFSMCDQVLHTLLQNDVQGYVYALDAQGFKKWTPFEHRVYESLYSLRTLSVGKEHLPFLPTEGQTSYKVPLNPLFALTF